MCEQLDHTTAQPDKSPSQLPQYNRPMTDAQQGRLTASIAFTSANIRKLQRRIGERAVERLLQRYTPPSDIFENDGEDENSRNQD